jgi:glutamine---fructose-6-phosphate transaminase (isomerizing)
MPEQYFNDTSFLDEIKQQSQALRDWAAWSTDPGHIKPVQDHLALDPSSRIVFSGMGSSLFAGMTAAHLLQKQGRNGLTLDARELISHYTPLLHNDTLTVIISQSGTSPEPVQLANTLNGRYLAITNRPDSPLGHAAICTIPLCAGEELHTTSKTYINSLAAAQTLASWILHDYSDLPKIWQAPSVEITRLIDCSQQYLPHALASLSGCSTVAIIGSGASFANACQAQLVLTEVAHLPAIAYTPGQFLHGPIEAIDQRFGAIVIDTPEMKEMTGNIVDEIAHYDGKVVCISTQANDTLKAGVTHIPIHWPFPDFSQVLEIVPIELLANAMGQAKGLQPGRLLRTQK